MESPGGLEIARKFIVDLAGDAKPEIEPQIRSVAGVPVRIFVPETVERRRTCTYTVGASRSALPR